jgi:CO/xanthine dehydrogenase FAD-binding subunit
VDYVRVTTEVELAHALHRSNAAILAGGTDLLAKVRSGVTRPALLVDVSRVESLRQVSASPAGLVLGAAVPIADILESPAVRSSYPLLADALRTLGSPQIRARGTLGGNLGNASPAADSAIALLAYDASVTLARGTTSRSVPLDQLFRGPGRTSLGPGEYIRSIDLPTPREDWMTFFHKVGKRRALTIAIASVAGLLVLRGRAIAGVRIAAGSVAPTPVRLREVESLLAGQTLDSSLAQTAGLAASRQVSPISDVRAPASYRRNVIGELVTRFLSQAALP